MGSLHRTTLACSLLLACSGDGNMATTQSTRTVDPTADSSGDPSDATAPTGTAPTGTASTTAGPDSDTATEATTGDAGLMGKYGAPCATDADCIAVLGEGGTCLKDILKVYAMPGGYCSTYCALPDQQMTYIPMAADCELGADCVGLMGYFEGCALPCTDDSQCPRGGYECRQMPVISNADDPTYCLMTEDNKI